MFRSKIARTRLTLALIAVPAVGQNTAPVEAATQACQTARPVPTISANAEQIATQIGVMPLVLRLRALASECNNTGTISLQELALRQQITEAVITASRNVAATLAEIDHERAQISAVSYLPSRLGCDAVH